MRISIILPALGFVACVVAATPSASGSSDFDLKGTWAAEGKACSFARLFVEFDGQDVLAYRPAAEKSRVAANYTAAFTGDKVTVNLVKLDSQESDEWRFIVDGADAMRLDGSFGRDLMKLTRCTRS